MTNVERTLAEQAAHQHGLITHHEALLHGLGRRQIQRRIEAGRWERVARGVYRIAGTPRTWKQDALAACFAAPDGAVISHLTAAALSGIWAAPPPTPHLTVPFGHSDRLTVATVHRARLGPTDATIREGIPVTTVGRTLIDCAAILGPTRLGGLVDEAFHQGLVTEGAVAHAWDLARLGPGRHGEVKLRAAIEPWTSVIRPGSPAEIRLRRQLVQWGFPEPELQIPIRAEDGTVIAMVDLGWSPGKIGVEYDSTRWHGQSRWASDLDRQAAIEALGWTLLRADKTDLQPGERSLRDALARAWSAAPRLRTP